MPEMRVEGGSAGAAAVPILDTGKTVGKQDCQLRQNRLSVWHERTTGDGIRCSPAHEWARTNSGPIQRMTTPAQDQSGATQPKILVVDDNETVLKAITLKLQSKGYAVCTAAKPPEALAKVRTEKPDLILLDIGFPEDLGGVQWDGFRLLDWFQRLNEEHKIPTIVIAGGDPAEYKARALK